MTVIHPMTDSGNAERFIDRHGHAFRFAEDRAEWWSWVTPVWRTRDAGPMYRAALETARSIRAEADLCDDERPNKNTKSEREKMLSWALVSESRRAMDSMLTVAAHLKPISTTSSAFNVDPWLLNTPKGIVDLRDDGSITPNRPEAMMTRCTRAKYDAMATCPEWSAFMKTITCGDVELEDYLQRAAGMTLIGNQRDHVVLFCSGDGGNGKGTFLNTLLWVLGDYGMTLQPNVLIEKRNDSHPTELADLEGMRMAVTAELPRNAAWDEVKLKSLSGADRIRAHKMRQDNVEFDASHTLWIAGNDQPRIRGTNAGIWRRMKAIPFDANIPPEEQDRDLPDKLKAESDGILWWMLEGCRMYRERGLADCAAVARKTSEYRRDEDLLGQFLDTCCIIDPSATVPKHIFRAAFTEWADSTGFHVPTDRSLKSDLARKEITDHRPAKSEPWVWMGVKLTPDVDMRARNATDRRKSFSKGEW